MTTKQRELMDEIFHAVSRVTSISYERFAGKVRKREIMVARQIFSYICVRDYCIGGEKGSGKLTLEVIGKYSGNKDHASIHARHHRAKEYIDTEAWFRDSVRKVDDLLVRNSGVVTDRLKFTLVDDSAPSGRADAAATQGCK